MLQSSSNLSEAVAKQSGAVETRDHFKNGASSKSHMSRGNILMKTFLFGLLCLLSVSNLFANPISLKSGNLSVLKQNTTASIEIDFSATKIDDMPFEEFVKENESKFRGGFYPIHNDHYINGFFNTFKKNKGMKPLKNTTNAPYKIVIRVNSFRAGSGVGAVVGGGLATQKSGGAHMDGTVDIVDVSTNEVVCTLNFENLKGKSAVLLTDRFAWVFYELGKQMCNFVKK